MTKEMKMVMAKKFIEAHMNGKVYLSTEGLNKLLNVVKKGELVK